MRCHILGHGGRAGNDAPLPRHPGDWSFTEHISILFLKHFILFSLVHPIIENAN